jgi:predicted nucleic acid-binding protein
VVTSAIAEVELRRAASRRAARAERVEAVLARVSLVDLSAEIRALAGTLEPPALRTLDAVHLATALVVGGSAAGFVCYDARLAAAAREQGLTVVAPT